MNSELNPGGKPTRRKMLGAMVSIAGASAALLGVDASQVVAEPSSPHAHAPEQLFAGADIFF